MSRYQLPELLAAPQTELGSIHQWCNTFSMDITTVSPKFQVVIPKRVREQFGLSPGQSLQVIALPGRIELVRSQPPAALRGFLQGKMLRVNPLGRRFIVDRQAAGANWNGPEPGLWADLGHGDRPRRSATEIGTGERDAMRRAIYTSEASEPGEVWATALAMDCWISSRLRIGPAARPCSPHWAGITAENQPSGTPLLGPGQITAASGCDHERVGWSYCRGRWEIKIHESAARGDN